jgi:uncharacterized repeat protein (TIGR03803 family)
MKISTRVRTFQHVLAFTAVVLCITASAWAGETVLYSFPGGANGQSPQGALARDSSGNLYGTTVGGGVTNNTGGCGIVFELTPASGGGYTPSVLYTFQSVSSTDGCNPESGVILDSTGNIYGTTINGGANGVGIVFELVHGSGDTWTENILWNFTSGDDGAYPGNIIFDSKGNLYGTTTAGGVQICTLDGAEAGCGTVYELTPTTSGEWNETTLYQFPNEDSGITPNSVAIDSQGNLFGTTFFGGPPPRVDCNSENGCGVVFELTRKTTGSFGYKVIYAFASKSTTDGENPTGVAISNGARLYGATNTGGTAGYGTVWELSYGKSGWTESILYNFQGGNDAASPNSPVLLGAGGALYGAAGSTGVEYCKGGCGTLFRLDDTKSGWEENVLLRFDKSDGDEYGSSAGLIQDPAGNLYGVTASGGSAGDGVVFEFTIP